MIVRPPTPAQRSGQRSSSLESIEFEQDRFSAVVSRLTTLQGPYVPAATILPATPTPSPEVSAQFSSGILSRQDQMGGQASPSPEPFAPFLSEGISHQDRMDDRTSSPQLLQSAVYLGIHIANSDFKRSFFESIELELEPTLHSIFEAIDYIPKLVLGKRMPEDAIVAISRLPLKIEGDYRHYTTRMRYLGLLSDVFGDDAEDKSSRVQPCPSSPECVEMLESMTFPTDRPLFSIYVLDTVCTDNVLLDPFSLHMQNALTLPNSVQSQESTSTDVTLQLPLVALENNPAPPVVRLEDLPEDVIVAGLVQKYPEFESWVLKLEKNAYKAAYGQYFRARLYVTIVDQEKAYGKGRVDMIVQRWLKVPTTPKTFKNIVSQFRVAKTTYDNLLKQNIDEKFQSNLAVLGVVLGGDLTLLSVPDQDIPFAMKVSVHSFKSILLSFASEKASLS
jgi:hypothetical protein